MPDLSALTQLEILYLHDNALTELPALPPSLTYLNVTENPLPVLSLGLPALIELRALDLGLTGCSLVSLPVLRELHLRRNRSPPSRTSCARCVSCACSTCARTG